MQPTLFSIRTRKDKKTNSQHLMFEGDIGLKCIDQIKTRIDSVEIDSKNIVIELNNIRSIDLSTVQLIYSIRKSLMNKGINVVLVTDISEEILQILRNTGFDDFSKP